jgi:hypothetical protein
MEGIVQTKEHRPSKPVLFLLLFDYRLLLFRLAEGAVLLGELGVGGVELVLDFGYVAGFDIGSG